MNTRTLLFSLALALPGVTGCASSVALDHAVIAYDTTATENIEKQLLLNIARAHHNEPIHFTAISSIAATYRFSFSAGVSGALTGDSGSLLVPLLGGSMEENPTISISPMEGEEFTQRLLTPFQEEKLTLLLRQGYDVDSLLRLLGAELTLGAANSGRTVVHYNRPADEAGYPVFRRVITHLSSIQDRHALYVEPLHFQLTWMVPAERVTPESLESTYNGFTLTLAPDRRSYRVSKRINGRVMVTNYDPAVLTNEERVHLHAEADEAPPNDILIDIRAGHTGGEFPLHGRLRLRSFHEILTFLGRGIEEEREFDVPPDPRTPTIHENPPHTLEIVETRRAPGGTGLSVRLHGRQYALRPEDGYQWNKKAFSLLYQLFQMSVAAEVNTGPEITIAK
ncbi:MAG: hypothetical protein ABR587_08795 [Candidatus Binatia bacterium]